MDIHDLALRVWTDLVGRPEGPLSLRFAIQPAVSMLLAIPDGVRDGRTDGPTFLIALVTGSTARRALLRDALSRVGRLLFVALALDAAYQVMVFRAIYPGEALLVALVFGFLPYALARGIVARAVRFRRRRG